MASRPRIIALIVAAGTGSRTGDDLPKQFRPVRGTPLLAHSYSAFANHPDISDIYVVIGQGQEHLATTAIEGMKPAKFTIGGASRRESVRNGLEAISTAQGADYVLVHDAARPFLPTRVIDDLISALVFAPGAVPALPVVDSLARGDESLSETVDRDGIWRIQTPQAFRFNDILAAHRNWSGPEPTDDARMMMAEGQDVRMVIGDETLSKFTFASDFERSDMTTDIRTGSGFDVHRLVPDEELWLCGIQIPYEKGLSGHSDADVAMHALTDAILGALALGDIGDHFPPSEAQWRGASSDRFLAHAMRLAVQQKYRLSSADVTIICEAPKIGPHKAAMRTRLAEIMGVDVARVSVKATTTEMLGFTGRGEGIAAQALATFVRCG